MTAEWKAVDQTADFFDEKDWCDEDADTLQRCSDPTVCPGHFTDEAWWIEGPTYVDVGDSVMMTRSLAELWAAAPATIEENARLRAALEQIEARTWTALARFRERGVVFEDIGNDPKNWQHVAFTVYSELCEASMDARDALAEAALANPRIPDGEDK